MQDGSAEYKRRDFLRTAGAAGVAAGLAGCGDSEKPTDESGTDNEPDLDEVNIVLEGESEMEADLTDTEYLETGTRVLKEEKYDDGTVDTTVLKPEEYSLQVTAQKTSKDGEYQQVVESRGDLFEAAEFEEETLKELGLYKELDEEVEITQDGEIRLPREDLITGYTKLDYNIEIPEAGEQTTVNQVVDVSKPQEEERDDVILDNHDITHDMRKRRVEHRIDNFDIGHVYDGLSGLRDAIMEGVDHNAEGQEMLKQISDEWAVKAYDHFNAYPSGLAAVLADIINVETDYRAVRLANQGHNIVMTMDIENDNIFGVDTSNYGIHRSDEIETIGPNGGQAVTPPSQNVWIQDNPESSPLYDGNGAVGTLESMVVDLDDAEVDARDRVNVDSNYAESVMPHFRDDTDSTEEIFREVESLGLSSLMHPEFEFSISGDPGKAEIDFERREN